MEGALFVRMLFWRLRRNARSTRHLPLLIVAVATILLVLGVSQNGRLKGVVVVRSACMPYLLRLPASWRVSLVPSVDCGDPVLLETYRLVAGGRPLTLTVEGVSMSGGRVMEEVDLTRYSPEVHHSRSGQAYVTFVDRRGGLVAASASFSRTGLVYKVTATGEAAGNPEAALVTAMNGWYEVPPG